MHYDKETWYSRLEKILKFPYFFNLFVTSKNEFSNSPIHEFKVLHKSKEPFKKVDEPAN